MLKLMNLHVRIFVNNIVNKNYTVGDVLKGAIEGAEKIL